MGIRVGPRLKCSVVREAVGTISTRASCGTDVGPIPCRATSLVGTIRGGGANVALSRERRMELGMPKVGDRVEAEDGSRGWLRFVGALEGKGSTVWYGVEWDDVSRGRHDGSYDGRRYFECQSGSSSGSFLQARKLAPRRRLEEALRERYGGGEDESGNGRDMLVAMPATGRGKLLAELRVGSVAGMQVVAAGCAVSASGSVCCSPGLEDLDMSNNLIASWDEVVDIVLYFPRLSSINLQCNRLREVKEAPRSLSNLRILVLSSMGLTSEQAAVIVESCPQLSELILHSNSVTEVPTLATSLPRSITRLDLSSNNLQSWSQVCSLASLPNLQRLILSDNGLASVPSVSTILPSSRNPGEQPWRSVSEMTLDNNPIADWSSVTHLRQLGHLHHLRLRDTKLTHLHGTDAVRAGIIARLRSVNVVNGGAVSADERLDAEKRYLQEQLVEKSKGKPVEDSERLAELESQFAMFDVADLPSSAPQQIPTLADQLLTVELKSAASTGESVRSMHKRLTPSMQVGQVKQLCRKLFKLPSTSPLRLEYVPPCQDREPLQEELPPPLVLEPDRNTLQSLKVSAGGIIYIHVGDD